MLAKPGTPFNSKDHLFEIKWDGTRTLAFINDVFGLRERLQSGIAAVQEARAWPVRRSRVSSSNRCRASASPVTARSSCPCTTAVDSSSLAALPSLRATSAARQSIRVGSGGSKNGKSWQCF
jgi:hypothetical protein